LVRTSCSCCETCSSRYELLILHYADSTQLQYFRGCLS
jgi:hypothetical protein